MIAPSSRDDDRSSATARSTSSIPPQIFHAGERLAEQKVRRACPGPMPTTTVTERRGCNRNATHARAHRAATKRRDVGGYVQEEVRSIFADARCGR